MVKIKVNPEIFPCIIIIAISSLSIIILEVNMCIRVQQFPALIFNSTWRSSWSISDSCFFSQMECPSASAPCPHLNIKFSTSGHNQGNQSTLRTPATPSKSCLALKRLQKASKVSENETVLQNCFNLISIFLPPKGRMKLQVSQTYRIVLKQDCQSCHIGKLGQALPARHLELCNTFSLFWENSDT